MPCCTQQCGATAENPGNFRDHCEGRHHSPCSNSQSIDFPGPLRGPAWDRSTTIWPVQIACCFLSPHHRFSLLNAPSSSRTFSYQAALDFLYDRINFEKWSDPPAKAGQGSTKRSDYQFRLRRTEELATKLGLGEFLFAGPVSSDSDPRCSKSSGAMPLIHIAGTKGKGSTATMVSDILLAAGCRVGLYTSPHLTVLEERFRVDGVPCSRDELCELVALVEPAVLTMEAAEGPVSFFELTTVLAMMHFRRSNCDAIVLEVGLGGRLDSTNVFASTVAAITSIGLDHQQVLGDTLAEIAFEKAGIIKSTSPVISGTRDPEAASVIRARANEENASLQELGSDFFVQRIKLIPGGSEFEVRFSDDDRPITVRLALEGVHQAENAAVAIACVRALAGKIDVTEEQIQRGLASVKLIGRVERFELSDQVQVVLDTAHNQDSFVALCDAIRARTASSEGTEHPVDTLRSPVVIVIGCSRDKDVASMIEQLVDVGDHFVGTQFSQNPRFMPLAKLQDAMARVESHACQFQLDPMKAFDEALKIASPGGTVVICGSFFLAGQLRNEVQSRAFRRQETPQGGQLLRRSSESEPPQ